VESVLLAKLPGSCPAPKFAVRTRTRPSSPALFLLAVICGFSASHSSAAEVGAITLRPPSLGPADTSPPAPLAIDATVTPILSAPASDVPSSNVSAFPTSSDAAAVVTVDSAEELAINPVAPVPEPATWIEASLALPFLFRLGARLHRNRRKGL
jgi:hypothetical protein